MLVQLHSRLKTLVYKFNLYFYEIVGRYRYVKTMANDRMKYLPNAELSHTEYTEVKKVWGRKYARTPFYKIYATSNLCNNITDYIPDTYYMSKIEPYFNKPLIARKNEDKNLYDLFFVGIRMPQTIIRYIDGIYMDNQYKIVSPKEAINKCQEGEEIIIKMASESGGGHGIVFWNRKTDSKEELINMITRGDNIIVQTLLTQHPAIAQLHPDSINTLRIMTLVYDGEVHIVANFIRMGIDGKKVDNVSSGGMLCGIQQDGTLNEIGYDEHGRPYKAHPNTGVVFKNCKIPNYYKCIELVKSLAPRLIHMAKIISWDVAIEADGLPTLIEANLTYCDIGIYQIACGPLFKDQLLKEKILSIIQTK